MAAQTITETIAPEPTMHMRLTNANATQPQATNRASQMPYRLRNLRLDPSRALEPARKKLTTIESQRIMAVFEEAIKRAEIVTAMPYVIKNLDRFRVSLGSELVDMLKQHYRVQSTYRDIRTQLDDLLRKRAAQIERVEAKNAAALAAAAAEERALIDKRDSIFDEFEDDELGEDHEAEDEEEESGDVSGNRDNNQGGESKEEDQEEDVSKDEKVLESTTEEQTVEESRPTAVGSATGSEKGSGLDNNAADRDDVAEHVDQMVSKDPPRGNSAQSATSIMTDYEPRIGEAMRNLGLVAQQVSHSCKNVLRLFNLNPAAMKVIVSDEESVRDEGGQKCVDSMKELRDILMHKLLTTPEEESERAAYLDDITKRERHNAAIIERLEKELKDAIDDKDEEIRKKNDVIKRLQTDLHQIEKFSDEGIRRTRAEAEKQEMADTKNSDQKTQKLQSEINALQTQLNNQISEHREVEADLRAKKYKVENEVDNWIQKYDQDLGERQDEYEEIDLVYTEEKKQLLELEERFATLEKEYMAIMEERHIAREKRERAQRELALLVKAATTIQAFWRSYKVRKALSKRKGPKKGKKGKK